MKRSGIAFPLSAMWSLREITESILPPDVVSVS